MLKLYHHQTFIGTVSGVCANGFDMHGLIDFAPEAVPFKPIFEYFQKRERPSSEEPPFDEDLLWNWSMTDEAGKRQEVGLPGVFEESDGIHVMWRWL